MSNSVFGLTARRINATFNGQRQAIALSTFVCMASSLQGVGFESPERAQARASRRKANFARRGNDAPAYFVEMHSDGVPGLEGARVYPVPTDGFEGIYDEYEMDEMSAVGTLMKRNGQWVVETDLELIETKRREIIRNTMEAGSRFIGKFGCDADAYLADLARRDQANGSMITRGHGLRCV